MNKKIASEIAIGIIILVSIVLGVAIYFDGDNMPKEDNIVVAPSETENPIDDGDQIACTMEAKLCPDGSYVSRTGPNCEFAECLNDNNFESNLSQGNGCEKMDVSLETINPDIVPKISFEYKNPENCSFDEPEKFYVIRDGKRVGEVEGGYESYVVFLHQQNEDYAYFSIPPGGLGGYYLSPVYINLYEIRFLDNKIRKVLEGGFFANDFSSDLGKIIYHSRSGFENPDLKDEIILLDLKSGSVKKYKNPIKSDSDQVSELLFSPKEDKVAISVKSGPDPEASWLYILNLESGTFNLIGEKKDGFIEVREWKNNNEIDYLK